jgi:hypothetical protein
MQLREILHHETFSVKLGSGYERVPSRLFYITAATDDKPIAGWSGLDSETWDGSLPRRLCMS